MKKNKSWEIITDIGLKIQKDWKRLALKYNLKITVSGQPALSTFVFDSKNHLKYKTLIILF